MQHVIDYHVHTAHSVDCRVPMIEMCHAASEAGLTEIAFTDHFNNHMLDTDLGYYKADQYFESLTRCRKIFPSLTIRAGIEVGEPHRWSKKVRPILDQYPYDVVLGSVHWVGNHSMFDPSFFASTSEAEAYRIYFQEVLRLVQHGGFDVVAHIDLPKRTAYGVYGRYQPAEFEDAIRPIFEQMISSGLSLEVNTKSFRSQVGEQHPADLMLRWYAEMGGTRVTMGSDAHQMAHIAFEFDNGRDALTAAGLTQVCRYQNRQVVEMVDLPRPVAAI